jgi:Flagellar biosynthesis protein, FliO
MPACGDKAWLLRLASFLVLGGPTAAWAQLAGGGAVPEVDFVRLGLALSVCLALGVAVIFLLRRHTPIRRLPGSSSLVRVVETVRLGSRCALYVVEFDGQKILLATDANGAVSVAARQAESGAGEAHAETPK